MDIEYLECDVEFIELAGAPTCEQDEAAAEAVIANWFTDCSLGCTASGAATGE